MTFASNLSGGSRNKSWPLLLLLTAWSILSVRSQTVLQPNDIQIVTFASDGTDTFSFVTWVDIVSNTVIYFTDEGWKGTGNGFRASSSVECLMKYTTTAQLSAGSVVTYDDTTYGTWNIEHGTLDFTSNGEQLYVFQGSYASPTFIFAFDNTRGIQTSGHNANGWEDDVLYIDGHDKGGLPENLVDGVSAVSFDHSDNFWYTPWYATSAVLPTLKEWMVNRDRFEYTSTLATRNADYEVPSGFTILTGERGVNGYTEYIPGDAPCIILSGHDGDVYPTDIDNRDHGCYDANANPTCDWNPSTCADVNRDETNCRAVTANDENTQDMARRAVDYFEAHTGARCHLVINRLARIKLDPNREIKEGAQFDATAINAYNEFHAYATTARNDVTSECGSGLVIDFHGHSHPEARIELGYKLTDDNLRENDATLDGLAYTSSIKNLPTHSCTNVAFSSLIRGSSSMGSLFEEATTLNATGYESVPSDTVQYPLESESYFQGGYNIEQHGSEGGGVIDAIQIEFPRYLRAEEFGMQEDVLKAFGEVVLPTFLTTHYPFSSAGACSSQTQTTCSPTPAPTPGPTPGPTPAPTPAGTVLQANDIQIVGFASDSPDTFSFVTWVNLSMDTIIYFTDEGWKGVGNGFRSSSSVECLIMFTASQSVPAGSVVTYSDTTYGAWNIEHGSFDFSQSGDQLYVFQGTYENPTFIFAFDSSGSWESASSHTTGAMPETLVSGVSAVSFAHADNFWYDPSLSTSGDLATLKARMVDRANFETTSSQSTYQANYEVPSAFTIVTRRRHLRRSGQP